MTTADNIAIPENFICPAFTVKDGVVDCINTAAANRGINTGLKMCELIQVGSAEYSAYTDGILCITLQISGNSYNASVGTMAGQQIVCLESDYEEPELRAFALAAQELRAPLSNALAQTAQILPIQQDSDAASSAAKLNKSLHQLLRAVCNMSDAAMYTNPHSANMQLQNGSWIIREILEKTKNLVQKSGRDLTYNLPEKEMQCYMDKEKIERAIFNLVSNAMKFSPKENVVHVNVTHHKNRLHLTVENKTVQYLPYTAANFFNRFIREPGLEDPRNGIGLGMSIVRSVATMHSGSLLLESKDNTVRVTMTIDTKVSKSASLRSPVMLPTDYAGGYDHAATEMSDILSDALYSE